MIHGQFLGLSFSNDVLIVVEVKSIIHISFRNLFLILWLGWETAFSNISFVNVLVRGRFRWAYDGVYHDEDGSLSGTPNTMIMAPDGLTNTSLFCSPLPSFENALQCPRSQGAWQRFALQELMNNSLGRLFIHNDVNASTIVPWLREQLTHENGYTVVVRANQSYTLSFETLIVSEIYESIDIEYHLNLDG
jgi:hypothetical protein